MLINPTHRHSGFTLLEILIALFIFTIVSAILGTALHSIFTTQAAVEKRTHRLEELQITLLLMSRDIEQIINRPVNVNGALKGMIGDKTTLTFTHAGLVNPFGQAHRSTLQRTRYEFNQQTLVRGTWPVLDPIRQEFDSRVLLNDLAAVEFTYLDKEGHFKTTWPPEDQTKALFPVAVRISLTLKDWGKITQLYLIPGISLEQKS